MKRFRGYVSSRPFMGERVPQHIQNIILRDYCDRMGFEYLLSATEYAMNGSYLSFRQAIKEIPTIDGIVSYSLFQMPESRQQRLMCFDNIIRKGGSLHFAVEGFQITAKSDVDTIEAIWLVRQTLPNCYFSDEYKLKINS